MKAVIKAVSLLAVITMLSGCIVAPGHHHDRGWHGGGGGWHDRGGHDRGWHGGPHRGR